jgi:cellulose synthase/poly-beta-1,6-N-acetylglucosamine synthase-like glycosyltransferase
MTILEIITAIVDVVLTTAVLGLIAVAASLLYLVALHYRHRKRGLAEEAALMAAAPPAALPEVLVQIPAFNEGAVLKRALSAAAALDWPREKLTIQLLDDSTDGTTRIAREAVAALAADGVKATLLHREARAGFKAGALAEGLAQSEAPFVAVLDVDHAPPPDFLKRCVPVMLADEKIGFVQARIEFVNSERNWLTRAQRLTLDAHCAIEQAGRCWAGLPFQFDGTGGVWRRQAIDEAGGWQGNTLSEDVDLSYRAYLAGWRGQYLLGTLVEAEMPETLGDWQTQQNRWSKGFTEVGVKLLSRIWRAPWPFGRRLASTVHVGLAAFYPLLMVALVTGALSLALHGAVLIPALLAAPALLLVLTPVTIVGMTYPGYRLLGRGGLGGYLACIASLPPLYIYLAFANTKGVIEALAGRATAFARTPKKGASEPAPETD